ncbi:ABC-2 type transport system ATP-binding protein [Allocatelliglobosispora scoriae]|uniref:ABC-2 type transport system ATP-binding protein n=1 Tax=Allocatelliglobosispora scoriae TaxID=643052 RepID=A0A841BPS4_9ACTN|nr:ABC transporter ATP-binding protein [Allocatelliglobosispora scoriae]MBB5868943.1 ABC-2 type transport system ATP-binding protein [Allocatelliglobosispora scoriae]
MAVIEVNNLTKRYADRTVVADVSFTVEAGEIFGIIGRNGVGKTTTVECISGLRVPDGGTVAVLGLDPQRHGVQLRRQVGVQLQESALQDRITVREALGLFASFYPDPARPEQLMDELGLTASRDTAYAKLSGGQKQRLSIALALVGNPKIAILDELTTGLDPQARRETWQLISGVRDRGVTILLVTHFMDEAERLCDRIAVIHDGRVAALDTPDGLTARIATGQVLRFRTKSPADLDALRALPAVSSVVDTDGDLVVAGTAEALPEAIVELSRQHLIPIGLKVEQATLDDAFIAITGTAPTGDPA